MMELVLAAISGVMAAACAAVAWRTAREARRRSEARVAALAATIDPPRGGEQRPHVDVSMPQPLNPLAKIGIGFGAVTVAIIAAALVIDAAERGSAAPARAQTPALELVTMQPQRQNGVLTVSGIIRNSSERPALGIVAEVTVVGTTGELLATRRVPIELQSLPPEANSSFSVTIDGVGAAQRYRIAFRGPEGIVKHVDRRVESHRQSADVAPATHRPATPQSGS
jgi:hypothetical protein